MSELKVHHEFVGKQTQPSQELQALRDESDINFQAETPFMIMSIKADRARPEYNFLAACFSWLTLAGYVVLPNTFTSIKASNTLGDSKSGKVVQTTVQNVPLLPFAGFLYIIGTVGTCRLWRKWRKNYVWLISRLFLPGFSNALIGLLTTLVNVVALQHGHFSVTAKISTIVITICGGSMLILTIVYNRMLDKIMTPRDKEIVLDGEP